MTIATDAGKRGTTNTKTQPPKAFANEQPMPTVVSLTSQTQNRFRCEERAKGRRSSSAPTAAFLAQLNVGMIESLKTAEYVLPGTNLQNGSIIFHPQEGNMIRLAQLLPIHHDIAGGFGWYVDGGG